MMNVDETCIHFCGDDDCPKCTIHGIISNCGGCTETRTVQERICISCTKLFDCPHRSGNKDGCINYQKFVGSK